MPSYDTVYKIRKLLSVTALESGKGTLDRLSVRDLALLALDNVDQSNSHGIIVAGRTAHGLHIAAIQAVLCKINSSIPVPVSNNSEDVQNLKEVVDPQAFVDGFIPPKDDPDIDAYISIFIWAVYRY